MRIELQIEGLDLLDRKLAGLPGKVAKKVVRSAVRNAQKIALEAIKRSTMRLPVSLRRFGTMAGGICGAWYLRVPKRQIPGSYALHVALANLPQFFHKSERTGKTSYIPAAIEFGHGATKEKAARPFARPAADQSRPRVQAQLEQDLGQGIDRAAMENP